MVFDPIKNLTRYFAEAEFQDKIEAITPNPTIITPVSPLDYPKFKSGDLLITRHRGTFIRPCPATPQYNCCGLNIFHFGQGCNLGCSYCILAAYLGSEALIVFGNIEDGLTELTQRLKEIHSSPQQAKTSQPLRSFRFCTGEFTDSLLLDRHSHLSSRLVELFRNYPPAILELKTKTAQVDHLLNLDHGNQTVISFSVNTPDVCRKEEKMAAPLTERLLAAARAMDKGYPIGLHFDPLIYYDGWEKGYRQTIDLICKYLDWSRIAWISLGCFRYLPGLKKIMLERQPSQLFDAEFIRAGDGKMRYPRPLRYLMYKTLLDYLDPLASPETNIYLCMESGRMWRDLFGRDPGTEGLTESFQNIEVQKNKLPTKSNQNQK